MRKPPSALNSFCCFCLTFNMAEYRVKIPPVSSAAVHSKEVVLLLLISNIYNECLLLLPLFVEVLFFVLIL